MWQQLQEWAYHVSRQEPPSWTHYSTWQRMSQEEKKWLAQEISEPSEFDEMQLRQKMVQQAEQGTSRVTHSICSHGTVYAVYDEGVTAEDVPWELWGQILRAFGGPRFTIFFLASRSPRVFPAAHQPITPKNINGGYTIPCKRQRIMIYRAEDATRVLLHELQHSACLDPPLPLDEIEAETEAWAEALHAVLLSPGSDQYLSRQWKWMVAQNKRVKQWIHHTRAFPWRYTVGKEEVWRRWGIPVSSTIRLPPVTLRLTYPPTEEDKRRFHVRKESIVL